MKNLPNRLVKKLLLITLVLSFLNSLNAASDSCFLLTLSIIDEHEQISRGYRFIRKDHLDLDSLDNTSYLIKTFRQKTLFRNEKDSTFEEKDSLLYFKDRIKYIYTDIPDSTGQTDTTYYLTSGTMLSYTSIRRIIIGEKMIVAIKDEIINRLRMSDTTWMNRKPISVATISSLHNSYQIFVHENSAQTKRILKQLKIRENQLNKLNKPDETASPDLIKSAKLNEELWELIQKIADLKVIVLQN